MKSRPKRWAEAVADAQSIVDQINTLVEDLDGAVDNVRSIQEEYREWQENLPEGLQEGATAEKLDAVTEIDFPDAISAEDLGEVVTAIEEAEAVDLPLGFGRD